MRNCSAEVRPSNTQWNQYLSTTVVVSLTSAVPLILRLIMETNEEEQTHITFKVSSKWRGICELRERKCVILRWWCFSRDNIRTVLISYTPLTTPRVGYKAGQGLKTFQWWFTTATQIKWLDLKTTLIKPPVDENYSSSHFPSILIL